MGTAHQRRKKRKEQGNAKRPTTSRSTRSPCRSRDRMDNTEGVQRCDPADEQRLAEAGRSSERRQERMRARRHSSARASIGVIT